MIKVTNTELNETFKTIRASYCELEGLTRFMRSFGYNSGVYGWNYTAFLFQASDGEYFVLTTGYRNTTSRRIAGVQAFEDELRKLDDIKTPWHERHELQKAVFRRFVDYVQTHYND